MFVLDDKNACASNKLPFTYKPPVDNWSPLWDVGRDKIKLQRKHPGFIDLKGDLPKIIDQYGQCWFIPVLSSITFHERHVVCNVGTWECC